MISVICIVLAVVAIIFFPSEFRTGAIILLILGGIPILDLVRQRIVRVCKGKQSN